jgi:hypothetical protein
MLAFLVDQLQEIACSTFKKALITAQRKKYLWDDIKGRFKNWILDSWDTLLNSIINPPTMVVPNSG